PPTSTLFPYTTLFRSVDLRAPDDECVPGLDHRRESGIERTHCAAARARPIGRAGDHDVVSSGKRPADRFTRSATHDHCVTKRKRSEEHTSELQSLAYL